VYQPYLFNDKNKFTIKKNSYRGTNGAILMDRHNKSLKKRLGQLKNNLKRRGYKQSIIKKSFNKANNISRSSLLQYKEKQKCKRTPCVLTYHPCLRSSFNTIRGHWTSVEKNSKLSKVFPEPPMVAFKQPNTKQSEKPVGAGRDVKA
jgi:hypothetical protein